MSQQITTVTESTAIGSEICAPQWNDADKKIIRDTCAKGSSDSEFELFLYMCQKYDLDPIVKQIWCIKYGDSKPATIFTSRDGFLHIAHKSGKFDGMETRAGRNDKGELVSAVCQVWRKDMRRPFVVEVSFDEYGRNASNVNWKTLPETMLKKVAESQCLRRAFDISGLYEPGEYEPEANNAQTEPKPVRKLPERYLAGEGLDPAEKTRLANLLAAYDSAENMEDLREIKNEKDSHIFSPQSIELLKEAHMRAGDRVKKWRAC